VEIFSVSKKDSVDRAFKLITEHKILSVPVKDEKDRYYAFVDVLDIVVHIVRQIHGTDQQSIAKLVKESGILNKDIVVNVADASGRDVYYPIEEEASLLTAIQLMAKRKMHRLPVIDVSGELVTIVTQSHIIKLIYENIAHFEFRTRSISDMKMGLKSVVTITKTQKALDAFQQIHDKKVSAVGVVDDEGCLVGNISASDLKTICSDASEISRLFLPADKFLELNTPGARFGPASFSLGTGNTFEDVLKALLLTQAHRLYVVDGSRKPVGVISLVDVLETIVHQTSSKH